ncbi:STAS domain-containing protein [Streptomyces sp. 5-8]|uniref:STAS domain-containing protein n=1 Tax=Streptomyces musisoli TaxID=2802280 RepID=A0ABS1PDF5_9ACTN|nr:STAS domain-containing protein [Streptomyces musisoli]
MWWCSPTWEELGSWREGELDLDTAAPLADASEAAVSDPTVRRIILDMSGVAFADSSLLNILLRIHRSGRLVAAGPIHHRLVVLLELTGAHTVLTITDSLAAAPAHPVGCPRRLRYAATPGRRRSAGSAPAPGRPPGRRPGRRGRRTAAASGPRPSRWCPGRSGQECG